MKIYIGKVKEILENYDNDISCFNARVFTEQSKAGLVLLKHVLEKENYQIQSFIKYNEYHKPMLDGVFYNISHSDELVVLAFSNEEVGVDIQKYKDTLERTKDKYYNEDDYDKSLLHLWVIKESYLKFIGVGLKNNIHEIIVKKDLVGYKGDMVMYKCYDLPNDYALAVCCNKIDNVSFVKV